MNQVFVIEGVAAASGSLLILYGPWQHACADYAKQRLFEARDTLFRLAAEGMIGFDHADYIELRGWINLLIRFAPVVSVVRILFHRLFAPPHSPGLRDPRRLISGENLPQACRDEMSAVITRCENILAITAVMRSPLLWVAIVLAAPAVIAGLYLPGAQRLIRQLVQRFARAVQDEAGSEVFDQIRLA